MRVMFRNLLIISIAAVLFAVPLLTKLEPPSAYSYFENRSLAAAPALTRESYFSGQYFQDWDTYLADHIFCRDWWLKSYVWVESNLLHRVVVNDVVLGGEVLLPYFPVRYAEEDVSAKAAEMGDALARLQEEIEAYGGQFLYAALPEQYSLFRDQYPAYLNSNGDRLEAARAAFFAALDQHSVDYLEFRPLFLAEPDYERYYFAGDHHYNLRGAYFTYARLCAALPALAAVGENEFTFVELPNPFYGSRSRKLYTVSPVSDRLLIYEGGPDLRFTRYDDGVAVAPRVFALPETATEPVQYTLYMGGDIAETVIKTNRPQLPDVLLFGDSFTNALETFLYLSADSFRSVDLRYYTEMSIADYIALYQPDIVICLRDDNSLLLQEGNGILGTETAAPATR